jgi:hypothetical protein
MLLFHHQQIAFACGYPEILLVQMVLSSDWYLMQRQLGQT